MASITRWPLPSSTHQRKVSSASFMILRVCYCLCNGTWVIGGTTWAKLERGTGCFPCFGSSSSSPLWGTVYHPLSLMLPALWAECKSVRVPEKASVLFGKEQGLLPDMLSIIYTQWRPYCARCWWGQFWPEQCPLKSVGGRVCVNLLSLAHCSGFSPSIPLRKALEVENRECHHKPFTKFFVPKLLLGAVASLHWLLVKTSELSALFLLYLLVKFCNLGWVFYVLEKNQWPISIGVHRNLLWVRSCLTFLLMSWRKLALPAWSSL